MSYQPVSTGSEDQDGIGNVEGDHPLLEGEEVDVKGGLREGSASALSSISNLANTILGTGMLAMPHAVAAGGMIPGALTIIFSACTSGLGLYLLSVSSTLTPHRASSFSALSKLTYPSASIFFDAAIAIKCAGVSCSYLIIIGALMPKVVMSLTSPGMEPEGVWLDRRLWITLAMFILVPLSFLKRLDSFRFTSYIALLAVVDLVAVVIWRSIDRSGLGERGEVELAKLSPALISSLPVYIFGFTCAQNLTPVFNELRTNSQRRMNLVIGTSIGSAAGIYEIIGLLGYLTFGSKVGSNIVEQYPASPAVAICRLGIVILVLFSYPLQLHPCRNSLDKVFRSRSKEGALVVGRSEGGDGDDTDVDEDHGSADDIPLGKFVTLTSVILLVTFVISMLVSQLELVLAFVGSTGSTTISFILPSIFYLSLFPPDSASTTSAGRRTTRTLAWLLLIYGMLIMTVCLGLNIAEVIHPGGTVGRGIEKPKVPEGPSEELIPGVY